MQCFFSSFETPALLFCSHGTPHNRAGAEGSIMSVPSVNLQITSRPSVLCLVLCEYVCEGVFCHIQREAASSSPSLLMLSKLHSVQLAVCSTKICGSFRCGEDASVSRVGRRRVIKRQEKNGCKVSLRGFVLLVWSLGVYVFITR